MEHALRKTLENFAGFMRGQGFMIPKEKCEIKGSSFNLTVYARTVREQMEAGKSPEESRENPSVSCLFEWVETQGGISVRYYHPSNGLVLPVLKAVDVRDAAKLLVHRDQWVKENCDSHPALDTRDELARDYKAVSPSVYS